MLSLKKVIGIKITVHHKPQYNINNWILKNFINKTLVIACQFIKVFQINLITTQRQSQNTHKIQNLFPRFHQKLEIDFRNYANF